MNKPTLHARVVKALNRAGLSDMHGAFYGEAHAYNVTTIALRIARRHLKTRRK